MFAFKERKEKMKAQNQRFTTLFFPASDRRAWGKKGVKKKKVINVKALKAVL